MDALFAAIAAHGGFSRDHLRKRFDGPLRFGLLDETDDGVEKRDTEDDRGIHPFAEQRRHDDGGEEDVNQRLVELLEKFQPRWCARAGLDAVQTEFFLATLYFIGGQAGFQIDVEQAHDFFILQLMPGIERCFQVIAPRFKSLVSGMSSPWRM